MTFCWTICPISWPLPPSTITRDFMNFAGRVSDNTTLPSASTTCSLCVRNWSTSATNRKTFLAALWPTCRTAPICRPFESKIANSWLTSISLAFWLTTSTDSVNSDPPPDSPTAMPALAMSTWIFSGDRFTVGRLAEPPGGSTDGRPWLETCSVQFVPS